MECDLRECTVKPFEAIRDDCRECLDTQSSACSSALLKWLQKRRLNASLVDAEVMFL